MESAATHMTGNELNKNEHNQIIYRRVSLQDSKILQQIRALLVKQQHPQEKNDYENLVIHDILQDKCKNIEKI